ncbi:MAG: CvpA family protein [Acidobacteriota bacterium]|nr:CvpA family protein [Acidobacteriota bacterium]
MNAFDILLLILISVLGLIGLLKGLTRVLIGTGALVTAFLIAAQFHQQVASAIARVVEIPEPVSSLLSYLSLFLGTMLAGAFLAYLLRRLIKVAMLSWADRLAGGAIGLMAALLAAGLIMLPGLAYAPSGDAILRQSVFAPYVTLVTDLATELVPEDLAVRYRNKMESLRQHWRQRFLESDPTALLVAQSRL